MELAKLGDTIECEVKHPFPSVIKLKLETIESCIEGNKLLLSKPNVWRLTKDAIFKKE